MVNILFDNRLTVATFLRQLLPFGWQRLMARLAKQLGGATTQHHFCRMVNHPDLVLIIGGDQAHRQVTDNFAGEGP
ncbi:hypothetical protein D3C77_645290 [compost metagenome]